MPCGWEALHLTPSTADRRKKGRVLRVGSTEEDLLVFRIDVWKVDLQNNTTRLGCSSVAERLPRMCWALGLILHWKKERVKCPCRELMLFQWNLNSSLPVCRHTEMTQEERLF